jgi:dipeptidyl aminopeptidase/acylaminoacyl peptidase
MGILTLSVRLEKMFTTHEGQSGFYFHSGGNRLLGTLYLAKGDDPKPTAVLLHGLPGIEKNCDLAHALRDHAWNSLIFHYRGSWGSEGVYAFKTIIADVCAAIDELSSGRHPQVDPGRLVLIGHSLGGWAAILAAVGDPRLRAVAVISAIVDPHLIEFSEADAAEGFTPWTNGITPEQLVKQWNELGKDHCPLEQVSKLAPRPLLIIHGGNDIFPPQEHAKALFERALDPREYILIPEANHYFSWHRTELRNHILEWLDRLNLA